MTLKFLIDLGDTKVNRYCLASRILTPLLFLSLAACGGGGGSSGGAGSSSTPSYTVSTSAGTGGSISPSSATVKDGGTTSFTVTPNTGYSIGTVSGCGGSLSGNTFTTGAVTADCTVTTSFTNTFTVSTSAGTGGNISPTSASVSYNGTTSFTVTANTNYSIGSVSGCAGSLSGTTYTTGAVTADCTVTASFVIDPVVFSNGQSASVVIGEPDFTASSGGTAQNLIGSAYGNPDVINGVLYLSDSENARVLGFNAIPTSNGASADFVLGASDFNGGGIGTTLGVPQTVVDYNGALYVDDYMYNRIAVYDTIPTATTSTPNAATPQTPDFYLTAGTVGSLNLPGAVAVGGGKLVVTDSGNNRVLIWNTTPTSDTTPDLVLGQADFSGTSANAGVSPTASTLNDPSGVWTDGTRLVVVDVNNNRVLIWNTFPTSDDQPADLVLGQPDFNSAQTNQGSSRTAGTMRAPDTGVYVSGNQLFVADTGNRRVLIWNSWPTVNDQAADVVLGQADFTTVATGPSQSLMDGPSGLYLSGTQLIVGDYNDYRYLIFDGHY